jgi:hypothetical protein
MKGWHSWSVLWQEALREAIGAPLQPIERAGYEQAVAIKRDHLGKEIFASEWALGRVMTADHVLTTGEQAIHLQHSQQNQHLFK